MSDAHAQYETSDILSNRKGLYEHVIGPSMQELVVDALEPFEGMSFLDAGCGYGDRTADIARRFPDSRCLGIDRSEGMIDRAKRSHPLPDLSFEVQDLSSNLPRATFDRILLVHVLHLVAPPFDRVIRNLTNALRPNGRLLLVLHSKESQPRRHDWERWFSEMSGCKYDTEQRSVDFETFPTSMESIRRAYLVAQTIRLASPEPYVRNLDTTRERWNPAPTDRDWHAFLEHARNEMTADISRTGHFDEETSNGFVIIET